MNGHTNKLNDNNGQCQTRVGSRRQQRGAVSYQIFITSAGIIGTIFSAAYGNLNHVKLVTTPVVTTPAPMVQAVQTMAQTTPIAATGNGAVNRPVTIKEVSRLEVADEYTIDTVLNAFEQNTGTNKKGGDNEKQNGLKTLEGLEDSILYQNDFFQDIIADQQDIWLLEDPDLNSNISGSLAAEGDITDGHDKASHEGGGEEGDYFDQHAQNAGIGIGGTVERH